MMGVDDDSERRKCHYHTGHTTTRGSKGNGKGVERNSVSVQDAHSHHFCNFAGAQTARFTEPPCSGVPVIRAGQGRSGHRLCAFSLRGSANLSVCECNPSNHFLKMGVDDGDERRKCQYHMGLRGDRRLRVILWRQPGKRRLIHTIHQTAKVDMRYYTCTAKPQGMANPRKHGSRTEIARTKSRSARISEPHRMRG